MYLLCEAVWPVVSPVIIEIKLPLIESEMVNKIACRQLFCFGALIGSAEGPLRGFASICLAFHLHMHGKKFIFVSLSPTVRFSVAETGFFSFIKMQIELIVVISPQIGYRLM